MLKRIALTFLAGAVVLSMVSCGGSQVQEDQPAVATETPSTQVSDGNNMAINAINQQLARGTISGFPMGSADLSQSKELQRAAEVAAILKPIVNKLPAGYQLEITGHSCNVGSANAKAQISRARAYNVYTELRNAGVAADKMKWKGASDSQLQAGIPGDDAAQRRITFKAISK